MSDVTIRSDMRPGDIGAVCLMHGRLYEREHGWDATFEAYVAKHLAELVLRASPRERVFLAERGAELVGCAAIAEAAPDVAQFRWFLVDPSERGQGLGRRLLLATIEFAREQGYSSIILWTVSTLTAAAAAYRAAGFAKVEEIAAERWGARVVEEKYELRLG
jgi:GNAT superfamily N-acetyltransferase